jgi:peptidoglycan/xylan/chitin deacetylase (PgdA/CDA1 family)
MPTFIKKVFSEALCNGPRDKKVLYLTFDDGPTPEVSSWVMNLLNRYKATATFFWLGKNMVRYPEYIEKAKSAGHLIANHTFDHPSGWKTRIDKYLKNIEDCDSVYASKYFRPPYGKLTWKLYQKIRREKQIVLWDVVSYDYDQKVGPEKCLAFTMKNISSGSIIVFHDSHKAWPKLKYVLPKVLERFTKEGYDFNTIKELKSSV